MRLSLSVESLHSGHHTVTNNRKHRDQISIDQQDSFRGKSKWHEEAPVSTKTLKKNQSFDFSKMQSRPNKIFTTATKTSYNYDLEPAKSFLQGANKGIKLYYPRHVGAKIRRGSVIGYQNNYYNNDADKVSQHVKVLSFEKTGHQPPSLLMPQGWQLRENPKRRSINKYHFGDKSEDRRYAEHIRRKRDVELNEILDTNMKLVE